MAQRHGVRVAVVAVALGGWVVAAFVLFLRDDASEPAGGGDGTEAPGDLPTATADGGEDASPPSSAPPIESVGPLIPDDSATPVLERRVTTSVAAVSEVAMAPPDPPLSTPLVSGLADPEIVADGEYFYAYGTNVAVAPGYWINVPVHQSADLETWHPRGDALPELPAWAKPGRTWGPGVIQAPDGRWVLYYSALLAGENPQRLKCIGRATADSPLGVFVDRSPEPLVCPRGEGGAIDPSPFREGDQLWLLWKNDGNADDRPTWLYSQRLSRDGLRVLDGPDPSATLIPCDCAWEGPLIEQPELLRDDRGGYWLFYSANWWDTANYGIGLAWCAAPDGPCQKISRDGPWFPRNQSVDGPGAASFFRDGSGTIYMAYHGYEPGTVGTDDERRSLRLETVEVVRDLPQVTSRN